MNDTHIGDDRSSGRLELRNGDLIRLWTESSPFVCRFVTQHKPQDERHSIVRRPDR